MKRKRKLRSPAYQWKQDEDGSWSFSCLHPNAPGRDPYTRTCPDCGATFQRRRFGKYYEEQLGLFDGPVRDPQ